MYQISDKQIDFILDDIRRRGIEMEDLQLNLLDHVCCIIEQNLSHDGDFEDFYKQTIPKFCKSELWEIEEETINLLIFKHYYTMKKIMIFSGLFGAFATLLGASFKVMHWPGANILMLLGIASMSLVFLPFMFTLKIKEKQNTKDKLILATGSIAATMVGITSLFKIMHWPYASILLSVTLSIVLLVFLPLYFISGIKNPETKVNTIVTSVLILAGTALSMVLPKASPSLTLSKATVNYMRNENQTLNTMKMLVKPDSLNQANMESYHAFMQSADKLKDAIINGIAGVDFQTYLKNDEQITPTVLTPVQFNAFPEKANFIEAVVDFESKLNSKIYTYEQMNEPVSGRAAEIDAALQAQPHVKDLTCFITNLQTQATLAMLGAK
ncbi:MAG: hypothetical protein JNK50_15945 [Bacteroidia bacterium]|nr:hypothetical protein [Bacteroidia bacterium]